MVTTITKETKDNLSVTNETKGMNNLTVTNETKT